MDLSFFKSMQAKIPLFNRNMSVLGLDIGATSIKIVQLRVEKEKAVLETYGELAIGPYADKAIGQAARLPDQKVSEAIADAVRETGATAHDTAVALPLRNSFVTLIEMPRLSESDLKTAMQYEARRYIPIPLAEVVVDWWRLPDDPHEEHSSVSTPARKTADVLLVAAPKEMVEKYRRVVTGASLEPTAFEIEIFGLIRSVIGREHQGVLVVDFGATTTKMAILDKGIIRASHSFDKGFQEATVALSESLGVNFERAETIKRETGISALPEHQGVLKIITPLVDYILIELERFAGNYARRYGISLSKIYVAGGGASMPGLVDYMIKKFGVEVLVANPFTKVEYPAFFQPVLKEIGPSFAVAVGLALRGLK